jgi:1-acyl-sn-glycerol-3-phosphate acyltransferase
LTTELRDKAPNADQIEERFRSPVVRSLRPALWWTISALRGLRRFDWEARFDADLEELEGPLVFAANHVSHADTAAILGTLPRALAPRTAVAAALDVFGPDRSRGLGRRISKDCLQLLVAAGFHAFAFDRHGPPLRSVRTSVQLIRNGWNLLLYPEGTRSRSSEMAEFKAGVGVLARFSQRPVIPVYVDGGDTILPYGAFMPRSGLAMVRFGEPLWFAADDTPESFTRRLQAEVRHLAARQARAAARLAYLSSRDTRAARKQPAWER